MSVGEPKRNKDYHAAVSPKRKTDVTESAAMARFAVAEKPKGSEALPEAFIALREATRRLKVKVRDQTRAVNRLHGLLSRVFPELAIAATWVLTLLHKYPTPAKIARSHPRTLANIKHVSLEKATRIHELASASIGALKGGYAEGLIRLAVEELQHVSKQRISLETMVENAFDELPAGGQKQLTSIPGIGIATAAVLTSKIVSIDRFATAEKLVSYFGLFPTTRQSGVDKDGQPKPPQTNRMCQQGNDLVRAYLYSAAKTAVRCNPAIRALYSRLRARGKRSDVALGHCMRKLLHLVFAVWSSNKPFDPEHFPWEAKSADEGNTDASSVMQSSSQAGEASTKNAAGRNPAQEPDRLAVTAASKIVNDAPPTVNATLQGKPQFDFALVRSQISIEKMLEYLGILDTLRPSGGELRGPCPIHSKECDKRRRHFAVNPEKNVFQCFHCQAQGNHLDFWAQLHDQSIYEAALNLVEVFDLEPSRLEKRSP